MEKIDSTFGKTDHLVGRREEKMLVVGNKLSKQCTQLDDVVTPDDADTEDYLCEATMYRRKRWRMMNHLRMEVFWNHPEA